MLNERVRGQGGRFVEWEKCSHCGKGLGVGISEDGRTIQRADAYWGFVHGDMVCAKCEQKAQLADRPQDTPAGD